MLEALTQASLWNETFWEGYPGFCMPGTNIEKRKYSINEFSIDIVWQRRARKSSIWDKHKDGKAHLMSLFRRVISYYDYVPHKTRPGGNWEGPLTCTKNHVYNLLLLDSYQPSSGTSSSVNIPASLK